MLFRLSRAPRASTATKTPSKGASTLAPVKPARSVRSSTCWAPAFRKEPYCRVKVTDPRRQNRVSKCRCSSWRGSGNGRSSRENRQARARASPVSSLLGQPEILPAQFNLLFLMLCPISLGLHVLKHQPNPREYQMKLVPLTGSSLCPVIFVLGHSILSVSWRESPPSARSFP